MCPCMCIEAHTLKYVWFFVLSCLLLNLPPKRTMALFRYLHVYTCMCCWQSPPATEFSNTSCSSCSSGWNDDHTCIRQNIMSSARSPVERARSEVTTNIGITRIISEVHLGLFTKIYTHEYNLLYSIPRCSKQLLGASVVSNTQPFPACS